MKTFSFLLISFTLVTTLAFGQSKDEMEIRQLEKHWTELLDKEDMAIVMGKELQQPENMTANYEDWIPRRFTNVWLKTKNGWQLAARQSSKVFTE